MPDTQIVEHSEYGDLGALAPTYVAETNQGESIARISLMQGQSKQGQTGEARPGQWLINYNDPTHDPEYEVVDTLRVWLLGNQARRTPWTRALTGNDDPENPRSCKSNDGAEPLDMYWETTLVDPRDGEKVEIAEGHLCEKCPLSQWKDGTPPPCSPSPMFVFYLIDQGVVATFENTSAHVNKPLIGGWTKASGKKRTYPGAVKMFRNFIRADGKPHAVILDHSFIERPNGMVQIPELRYDEDPITTDESQVIRGVIESYNKALHTFLMNADTDADEEAQGEEKEDDNHPW